ncbi:MAG: hypothetical protein COB29_01160 [Sulfitobacter sp.]|nr:MAG: hypothetical protein COB29_01160 [Sulfitobacter sp.]
MRLEKISTLHWATEGDYSDQVSTTFAAIRAIGEQAELIADKNFPITVPMLCQTFVDLLPKRFENEYETYREIHTLAKLQEKANRDAKRFDKSAQRPGHTMITPTSSPAMYSESEKQMVRALAARIDSGASTPSSVVAGGNTFTLEELRRALMPGAKKPTKWKYATQKERLDKNTVPKDGDVWCDHKWHGWGDHTTSNCRQLLAKGKEVNFIKNDNGTYTMVTNMTSTMATMQEALALTVQANINIDFKTFVDNCSDLSWATRLSDLFDVELLDTSEAPWVNGTNLGAPVRATHRGKRTHRFNNVEYTEIAHYSAQFAFNITSTHQLAKAGISTFVDADDEGCDNEEGRRCFLIPGKKSEYHGGRYVCERVGNIWVLPPPDPKQVVDGATTYKAMCARASVDQPTHKSPAQAHSKSFRATLGNLSHRETMSTAQRAGVKLTNVDGARVALDEQMRIANQRSRPMVKVELSSLNDLNVTTIVTDTVGSQFPLSAEGNRTLQTYENLTDGGGYYAYVGKDHSAATSWDNFVKFSRDSGLKVEATAVNQAITICSDNGTEYKGVFASKCNQGGIRQSTSTAWKKSSGKQAAAELNNKRVQERLRANMVLARPNFASFALDERQYWDCAAEYGALQDRVRSEVSKGSISYAQLRRETPAAFGAKGTALQTNSPYRGQKQLSDRGEPGLLIGVRDHKCKMLMKDGSVMFTSDVTFGIDNSGETSTADDDRYDGFEELDSNVVEMLSPSMAKLQ